ncbi:MAG: mandelate racemase/muconate lactonizing enzyme family protein [Pseudomonadota bacterium]
MKITAVKTQLVNLPLEQPVKTAIHDIETVGCVLLSLETDTGLVGQSYLFSINAVRIKAFDEMVRGFSHQLLQKDPHYINAIWQNIWDEINPTGYKGLTISALSAIDTACWDLVGKAAEKPLHMLFGACRDRIKTYASGGLWLTQSIDELVTEAERFIDQGFRAMKLRLGSGNQGQDVERVKQLRNAVGSEIELMADLNQALSAKQAIRLGHALQEYDLQWIEEPVLANDLRGHAQVTAALQTPVASGETEYTRYGMQAMIDHRACDILMPDLQRIGGLSEMLRVAAIASAHHLPISTHIFTEHSLSIAGSAANCISVEHMPWFAELFNEEMIVENGDILIPDRPGTGFTFNQATINRYRL